MSSYVNWNFPTFITTTQLAVPNFHHPKLNHHNTIAIGISQHSSSQQNQQFVMFITLNSPVPTLHFMQKANLPHASK
jgi:hypothetical protein